MLVAYDASGHRVLLNIDQFGRKNCWELHGPFPVPSVAWEWGEADDEWSCSPAAFGYVEHVPSCRDRTPSERKRCGRWRVWAMEMVNRSVALKRYGFVPEVEARFRGKSLGYFLDQPSADRELLAWAEAGMNSLLRAAELRWSARAKRKHEALRRLAQRLQPAKMWPAYPPRDTNAPYWPVPLILPIGVTARWNRRREAVDFLAGDSVYASLDDVLDATLVARQGWRKRAVPKQVKYRRYK